MKDLPMTLRLLADAIEANGGELPPMITGKPAQKTTKPKQKNVGASFASTIVKKHFYGK